MIYKNNFVHATDINDGWRQSLLCIAENGIPYVIKGGSYIGQIRRQLLHFTLYIEEPWRKPFNFFTPPGVPAPTNPKKINEYFEQYLITQTKTKNEDYNYSDYIVQQYPHIIRMLNKTQGQTNQAIITIGEPASITLNSPPCLRNIHFTNVNNQLVMTVYFRSWDAYAGLPENLGGLQLFKEFILMNLEFSIKDGPLIAYSSGIHIYSMYDAIVEQLGASYNKE